MQLDAGAVEGWVLIDWPWIVNLFAWNPSKRHKGRLYGEQVVVVTNEANGP